jgi:hypothetical protein
MATSTLNNKIHPSVDAVIKPIVYEMTRIDIAQKTNPIIGSNNEPDFVKEAKKKCVHIIFEGGEYRLATQKNADGKLYCRACGRPIGVKFDQSAIDKITDCIEVINQLLLFGLLNGLRAEPIQTLISIKSTLPAASQLLSNLNEFVKRDNAAANDAANIGTEYAIPNQYRSITSLG